MSRYGYPETRSPTARAVPPACLIVRAVQPFSDSVGVLVVLVALGVKTNARPVTRTCDDVVLAVFPVYASDVIVTAETIATEFSSTFSRRAFSSAATGPDATRTKLLAVPMRNSISTG